VSLIWSVAVWNEPLMLFPALFYLSLGRDITGKVVLVMATSAAFHHICPYSWSLTRAMA
jgi:hypothetical protein